MSDKIREEFEKIYKYEDNCDMNFKMNKNNSAYLDEYTESGFQFFKDGNIYPRKGIKELRKVITLIKNWVVDDEETLKLSDKERMKTVYILAVLALKESE